LPTLSVVRAFRCQSADLTPQFRYLDLCSQLTALPQAVLVDAFASGAYGGTGQRVDWPSLAKRGSQLHNLPVILAGGLTPANVAEAIRLSQADAVDVASGVESSPGKKDEALVQTFITNAQSAFDVGC
jgi:phosphoribosylanthranilate isomerase